MKPNLFLSLTATVLLCAGARAQTAERDLFADTWVATDGLQRSLPDGAQVGVPRVRKAGGDVLFPYFWRVKGAAFTGGYSPRFAGYRVCA